MDDSTKDLTEFPAAGMGNVRVFVVGTAHLSQPSIELVQNVIRYMKPQVVMLELDRSRASFLEEPAGVDSETENKEKDDQHDHDQSFFSILLDSWKKSRQNVPTLDLVMRAISISQTRALLRGKSDISLYGGEFRHAYREAQAIGSTVVLGDRNIRVGFMRIWNELSFIESVKILLSIVYSYFFMKIDEDMIQELMQSDMSEMMAEFLKDYPITANVLITERNHYLVNNLRLWALKLKQKLKEREENGADDGQRNEQGVILAVVGKGHIKGMLEEWNNINSNNDNGINDDEEIKKCVVRLMGLSKLPKPKTRRVSMASICLALFAAMLAFFVYVYVYGG